MVQYHHLVSVIELSAGTLSLIVVALAWRHRRERAGTPLVVLAAGAAVWAVAAGAASLFVDPNITRFTQVITYGVSGPVAVSWFYLVVEYTHSDPETRKLQHALLVGLVVLDLISLATNSIHHLYFTGTVMMQGPGFFDPTPGLLLWANTAWKAGVVLAGVWMLGDRFVRRPKIVRWQSIAIGTSGLVPLIGGVLELSDVFSVPGLDLSAIGIAISAVIILWALSYADFLDVVPIARETLWESITDPAVALNRDDTIVDINQRARQVFGLHGEAIGNPVTEVFDQYAADIGDQISNRADSVEISTEVGGETRHFELNISPVVSGGKTKRIAREKEDRKVGTIILFRDITLQKTRERELQQKNERLDDFASVVSHDLLNPLSVAQGRLTVEQEMNDSENLKKAAQALDSMEALITDLLVLSRGGSVVSDRDTVALKDVGEDCWADVQAEDASLDIPTDLTIRADRTRLRELIDNLVQNAIEHGGDGVTITIGELEEGQGFYVEDTGKGIPKDKDEQIFERGYSTSPAGTGFGLPIVREIAKGHSWSIQVASSEKGGARFEFADVEIIETAE